MRLVKKWVALPRTPREKGTLHVDRYTAPTKSVVAFQPNLLHYAHGLPPRAVRRRLLTISLLTLFCAFVALWTRSHIVEDEVRWMHGGVHRHLESARGYLTFVSTSGHASADYFVWAASPNLSYGRATNWYDVGPQSLAQWHVRVHYPTVVLASAVLLVGTVCKRGDKRTYEENTLAAGRVFRGCGSTTASSERTARRPTSHTRFGSR